MRYCLLILLLPLPVMVMADSLDEKFKTLEYSITTTSQEVNHKLVLDKAINKSAQTKNFIIFASNRELWIKKRNSKLVKLTIKNRVKHKFDWFVDMCASDERVFIQVSLYPEEQRVKENDSALGGFRKGPEAVGLLVVGQDKIDFVKEFKVVKNYTKSPFKEESDWNIKSINPEIQSCVWEGKTLLIGAGGVLARLDIEKRQIIRVRTQYSLIYEKL